MGFATNSNSTTVRVIAASATLTGSDNYVSVQGPAANVVVTLPLLSGLNAGHAYVISRDETATHTVTVTPNAANKLNGLTAGTGTAIGAAGKAGGCVVVSDGTEWFFVGAYAVP